MMQDVETGAAGRDFGFRMAAHVIETLRLQRTSEKSNEVIWDGRRAIVKSCGRKTTNYGVTVGTLDRIEVVLAAFTMAHRVEVWCLSVENFKQGMRDSRSRSANGKVKQVGKGFTRMWGRKIAELSLPIWGLC